MAIDVNPYSAANEIQPESDKPIFVAILSTNVANGDAVDFDATQVDPTSVRFGPGEATSATATPWLVDAGADGDTDAVYKFATQDAGILCGDNEVSLTGQTYAGALIQATDSIVTTECTTSSCHP